MERNTHPRYQNIMQLLSSIEKVKSKYDTDRGADRFNIFYALHKEHDEVNLHSRFISYLLAKNSGHGEDCLFAKLLFEIIFDGKNDSGKPFLDDYEVIPNEFNKTEFKEIDILMVNKKLSHAIIIENKIYAKDSNHKGKNDGYNGQLERYYNTIKKRVPFDNKESVENIEFESHDYICENVDVFYLSLNPPEKASFEISKGNIPESECVRKLSYEYTIVPWLENCLKEIENSNDCFLEKVINQYLILVKNMTKTNVPLEERKALREVFSKNSKNSKNLEITKYMIDNFNHIKWHTVDDFLMSLRNKIKNEGYENVELYPLNDNERAQLITDLTHHNKNKNLGIRFQANNKAYYISTLNNLSWGATEPETKEWHDFKSADELENIRFSDFSTDNTYRLINTEYMEKAIDTIINEITDTIANKV